MPIAGFRNCLRGSRSHDVPSRQPGPLWSPRRLRRASAPRQGRPLARANTPVTLPPQLYPRPDQPVHQISGHQIPNPPLHWGCGRGERHSPSFRPWSSSPGFHCPCGADHRCLWSAFSRHLPAVEQSARTAMSAVPPTETAGMTAGVASKIARSTGFWLRLCCSVGRPILATRRPSGRHHHRRAAEPQEAVCSPVPISVTGLYQDPSAYEPTAPQADETESESRGGSFAPGTCAHTMKCRKNRSRSRFFFPWRIPTLKRHR